jgi:V/A-type H+-transporting ATPase subunit I
MGAAHVVLGLCLGVWGALRQRQWGHAAQRVGVLAAVAGAVALGAVVGGWLGSGWVAAGIGFIGVGAVVVLVSHGALGVLLAPIEVLEAMGNVLSYLRLAALGLASVYLARAANELGGLGPLWLGVVVAALLHAVNIALGVVSPTIQALRLHYVEFFRQFYEPGGRPFVPFGTREQGPDPREEATWTKA